jgi:MFS family permease
LAKATKRLVPVLFIVYVMAYIDRVNIGFAALQMNQDLKLSATAYGLGAGIFFLGYFIVEIPSNMILERVGARRWITRIMVSWGVIAAATLLARGEVSLIILRFLLGVAEAGLFPGLILYLTYWFPARWRTRAVAGFMTAIPIAGIISSPVSGALLQYGDGWFGLRGWQIMFLVEGLAAVILAGVAWFGLPDGPSSARWLTDEERGWIHAELAADEAAKPAASDTRPGFRRTVTNGRVWAFTLVYFTLATCTAGITLWLGILLKAVSGGSPTVVGLLGMIPYICSALAMVWYARHADRQNERRWHCVLAALVAAAGFLLTGIAPGSTAFQIIALSIAASGVMCATCTFWALPTGYLTVSMAAVGIALINCVGNLGGFIGPYVIGLVKDLTGQYYGGMVLLAILAVVGACVVVLASRIRQPQHINFQPDRRAVSS